MKHYTQIGVGVYNGCGPANVGMMASAFDPSFDLDIKTIAHQVGNDGGFSDIWRIQAALRHYGIQNEATRFATLSWYEDMVGRQGIPVIALVSYDQFSNRMYNYQQAHFMVVVGIDAEYVYAHDPLRKDGPTRFPKFEFVRAINAQSWGYNKDKTKWYNYSNQAIYPLRKPITDPVMQEIREHLKEIEWLLA